MSRKRAKERDQTALANPPVKKGDSKRTMGTRHPDLAFLDEEEHKLMVKRRVLTDLRTLLDSLHQSYDDSKDTLLKEYAKFVTNSFATYIQTKTYVESNGAVFVPVKPTSHRAPSTGVRFDLETNKHKTWADVAMSSTSSAPTTSRSSLKSMLKPASTRSSGPSMAGTDTDKLDLRILIKIAGEKLRSRDQPFALRQATARVAGLAMEEVPECTPTRTGWALRFSRLAARDLMMEEQHIQQLHKIFTAEEVTIPQKWYNYAVPLVPRLIRDHVEGSLLEVPELIEDEARTQTGLKPVSCRLSRHGYNAETGLATWIVSFQEPVKRFRLFGTSGLARLIDKTPRPEIHDPGCMGYCNPAKCSRVARCRNCGQRNKDHTPGPCSNPPQCANCQGPWPAGHNDCGARPIRKNGVLKKPSRRELQTLRRQGIRAYKSKNELPEESRAERADIHTAEKETPGKNNATNKRKKTGATVEYIASSPSSYSSLSPPPPSSPGLRAQESMEGITTQQNDEPVQRSKRSTTGIYNKLDNETMFADLTEATSSDEW